MSNAASYYYGTSTTAAATAQKEVTIEGITTLAAGQIIAVKPTLTSTVANSTIKLNNFAAYPMRYRNTAITTSTDSIVWYTNTVSFFVFDGSYWHFAGGGTDNTSYTAMTQSHINAGTSTTSMVTSPKLLLDNFYTETETDTLLGNKQNRPNKSGEATAANGKVLTYTTNSLDSDVAARYIQVPVANGDPNDGGTLNSTTPLASVWVE